MLLRMILKNRQVAHSCPSGRRDLAHLLRRGQVSAGGRDGQNQRAHLLDPTRLHMSQGHGHHHRQRQSDAGLHFGLTPDEVALEAEAVVDAVVDPLQGAAPVVAALPGGAGMWRHRPVDLLLVQGS